MEIFIGTWKFPLEHRLFFIGTYWKSGKISRDLLYKELSKFIGREYHTADIRSIEEANRIYEYIVN